MQDSQLSLEGMHEKGATAHLSHLILHVAHNVADPDLSILRDFVAIQPTSVLMSGTLLETFLV